MAISPHRLAVTNECTSNAHDCSANAQCIDQISGFTCRCRDGHRDDSPDVFKRPGRVCVESRQPDPPECDVDDPLACNTKLSEVRAH